MAQPMAAAQPIQPGMVKPQVVGYPQQQAYPQPMVQQGYAPQTTTTVITMGGGGQQPPPGAPPGGVWRQMNYCGPVTWLIGIDPLVAQVVDHTEEEEAREEKNEDEATGLCGPRIPSWFCWS